MKRTIKYVILIVVTLLVSINRVDADNGTPTPGISSEQRAGQICNKCMYSCYSSTYQENIILFSYYWSTEIANHLDNDLGPDNCSRVCSKVDDVIERPDCEESPKRIDLYSDEEVNSGFKCYYNGTDRVWNYGSPGNGWKLEEERNGKQLNDYYSCLGVINDNGGLISCLKCENEDSYVKKYAYIWSSQEGPFDLEHINNSSFKVQYSNCKPVNDAQTFTTCNAKNGTSPMYKYNDYKCYSNNDGSKRVVNTTKYGDYINEEKTIELEECELQLSYAETAYKCWGCNTREDEDIKDYYFWSIGDPSRGNENKDCDIFSYDSFQTCEARKEDGGKNTTMADFDHGFTKSCFNCKGSLYWTYYAPNCKEIDDEKFNSKESCNGKAPASCWECEEKEPRYTSFDLTNEKGCKQVEKNRADCIGADVTCYRVENEFGGSELILMTEEQYNSTCIDEGRECEETSLNEDEACEGKAKNINNEEILGDGSIIYEQFNSLFPTIGFGPEGMRCEELLGPTLTDLIKLISWIGGFDDLSCIFG